MNKREFIKLAGLGSMSFSTLPVLGKGLEAKRQSKVFKKGYYLWMRPDKNQTTSEMKTLFVKYKNSGIQGIFFEGDSKAHFSEAKNAGMQAHHWMWTMNRGEKSLLEGHPEWYAINRKGESCATKPPYVDYYRWLCPTKVEVKNYLLDRSEEIVARDYVDGLHLDYVRYCDVILAVNLWTKYDIVQQQEYPEYDYCYCEDCRAAYEKEYGKDPLEIKYPGQQDSWRQFRYQQVNKIVNALSDKVHEYKKPISAAVFPTPEIARRIVRQDWTNWNLDAAFPMIYHGFYQEPTHWIGSAAKEGLRVLKGDFPLYAGIYLPDFKDLKDIEVGIKSAQNAGVNGISLFGDVNDDLLKIVKANNSWG